jgi:hypothetical protein
MEEFVLQRVTERTWWVTRQFYGFLFYVGKRGVLLFDSPSAQPTRRWRRSPR